MHGMAPHMHMACTEEQEDGDGEVAEGEPHHVLGTCGSTTNSLIPNVIRKVPSPRALYVRRAQIPEYREQFLFPLLYSWETTRSGLRDAVGNVRRPAATSSAGGPARRGFGTRAHLRSGGYVLP